MKANAVTEMQIMKEDDERQERLYGTIPPQDDDQPGELLAYK